MVARILSGLVGVLMLLNSFWWLLDPATAAEELAMSVQERSKISNLSVPS